MRFQETFKALSDPTRRNILEILKPGRMTAGEIVNKFDVTGATISRHLSILKEAGLVSDTKKGKYIYYELNTSVVEEAMQWLAGIIGKDEAK
ncbi:transcriptional regulator, ArsR family [Atopostipes suicloacalis DSM 15692]|uniref:Transcriptional regulator, ArsR family n=1 Tax=Atopostipes suicloacalis DSM 15692 TaxID=1121025 RepID=A0A1M4ZDS7_9LACT|nr:autorepressor SdpR family transcription factor [Atopostipes suicloacalis]SHF16161.1 transcriptional regulator, ArsR family [Atopostipes suicloacalis DSM 15692]